MLLVWCFSNFFKITIQLRYGTGMDQQFSMSSQTENSLIIQEGHPAVKLASKWLEKLAPKNLPVRLSQ
jgi:hypothetical protein